MSPLPSWFSPSHFCSVPTPSTRLSLLFIPLLFHHSVSIHLCRVHSYKSRQEAMILLAFSPWISIYKFPNADSKLYHELAFCLWIMKCAFLGTVCFASGCIWSKQLRAQCQWSQGPGSSPALVQPSSALAWILPKASSLLFYLSALSDTDRSANPLKI